MIFLTFEISKACIRVYAQTTFLESPFLNLIGSEESRSQESYSPAGEIDALVGKTLPCASIKTGAQISKTHMKSQVDVMACRSPQHSDETTDLWSKPVT